MQLRQLRYFTRLVREGYFGLASQTGGTVFNGVDEPGHSDAG